MAATVTPQRPGHLAWVYVCPFVNPDTTIRLRGRMYRLEPGNPIRGYLVRYVEADAQVVEQFPTSDQDDLPSTAADVILEVATEEELALALGRWMSDFNSLGDLRAAGYWFANGWQLQWSKIIEQRERDQQYRENELQPQILAEQQLLAGLPKHSAEYDEHRRRLKQLAESWRRAVRREVGWNQGTSVATAKRMLDIDEDALIRLVDWGLLTVCDFPEQARLDGYRVVLLGGEIRCLLDSERTVNDEPLPVDEIWWRGLVDLEP